MTEKTVFYKLEAFDGEIWTGNDSTFETLEVAQTVSQLARIISGLKKEDTRILKCEVIDE